MTWIRIAKNYKANVRTRANTVLGARTLADLQRSLGKNIHQWLSEEDIDELSAKQITMFINGTASIRICGNCKLYFINSNTEFLRWSKVNLKKFGYQFRCYFCGQNKAKPKGYLERSEKLKTIHDHIIQNFESANNIKTE